MFVFQRTESNDIFRGVPGLPGDGPGLVGVDADDLFGVLGAAVAEDHDELVAVGSALVPGFPASLKLLQRRVGELQTLAVVGNMPTQFQRQENMLTAF